MLTKLSNTQLAENFDEKIDSLEKEMLQLPQAECPVTHRFGPGIYIREVRMSADTYAIGHFQKTKHLNIMLEGRVIVINNDGSTEELVAPLTYVGEPGRKAGYIIEDVLWQNVYATNETDIDKLEATYLDKSEGFLLNEKMNKVAMNMDSEIHRIDYNSAISEMGISEKEVREISENMADQIGMPGPVHPYRIFESPIEGNGYFLTVPAIAGGILAPARIDGKRTPAGRFVNHSKSPNAKMQLAENGNIYLVAINDIKGCCGGDSGDEVTIDYRDAIKLTLSLSNEGELCLE